MILITVILKTSSQVIQFHFDQFKDADAVLKRFKEDSADEFIEDDYGSKAYIVNEEIAGIFLTDLERELEANEKCQMAKIQLDIRIQKKIQQDPGARLLMPTRGVA